MSGTKPKALILACAALALAAVAVVVAFRDRTPPLLRGDFERATRLWEEERLASYTITVSKEADAIGSERFVTEVHDGQAVSMRLNEEPLAPTDTYTVTGLLDTIERELEMAEETTRQDGQPRDAVLKASFDPTLGLPMVFKRIASDRKSFVLRIEELRVPDRGVIFPATDA